MAAAVTPARCTWIGSEGGIFKDLSWFIGGGATGGGGGTSLGGGA